nr:hypothetical protein [Candidatus Sigynarchaeota archaeon]
MTFKTLIIKDLEHNLFDWATKITDGDVAFIIDQDSKVIYVWNGQRTSMIKKYESGVIAPKLKSVLQLYPFKITIVEQGEEKNELKAEVEKLLNGEGTPVGNEERDSLASAIESLAAARAQGLELTGGAATEAVPVAGEPAKKSTGKAKDDQAEYRKLLEGKIQDISAENETLKKDLETEKAKLDDKIKIVDLEKEKLKVEAEAEKKEAEATARDLEAKVKYLELEKSKIQGETGAARNELAAMKAADEEKIQGLRSEIDALKEVLKTDLGATKKDLESARKENDALKKEMDEKIKKIKEEYAERVKLNFFNMKALPSAPAGTVWFESIVQVIAGDKTVFTKDVDMEKLKALENKLEKPKEIKPELKPSSVIKASVVPIPEQKATVVPSPEKKATVVPSPEKNVEAKALVEKLAATVASVVKKAETKPAPAKIEAPKAQPPPEESTELDFVNIEDETEKLREKKKKGDDLDFPDLG